MPICKKHNWSNPQTYCPMCSNIVTTWSNPMREILEDFPESRYQSDSYYPKIDQRWEDKENDKQRELENENP